MTRLSVHGSMLAALLVLAGCATAPVKSPPMLDLKITNGRILDGTGAPWFRADLGVRGDTIVAIGDLSKVQAANVIDAGDRIVSPGFIDLLGQSQHSVINAPFVEAKVRQGVTTEVTGEGFSPGPVSPSSNTLSDRRYATLGEYLDLLDRKGIGINFALLVGASNPRQMVLGNVNRQPTMDEMRQMEAIVDQAMRDGAIGISTSLIYLPAMFSTTEEIINLARVATKYDGVYFTHLRSEAEKIEEALDEAFRVGREAKIPVNIWHIKIGPRSRWGQMPDVIARIDAARKGGLDVAGNIYPYIASSTSLSTLAPDWALEGGYAEFRKRLADPEQRARILAEFRRQHERRGERGIYVARIGNRAHQAYEKKHLEDIATAMGTSPDEALARIFTENESSPAAIFFGMHEDDVRYALKQPWVSVGADSGAPTPEARAGNVAIHPRAYGTFPRVAGHYVRDVKLFSLEEAVRKMTSQAALRANLQDRGILRAGMKADVIVFDPDAIADRATFDNPHQFAAGVEHVVVNGVAVLRNGELTKALPGRTLRGKGYKGAGVRR